MLLRLRFWWALFAIVLSQYRAWREDCERIEALPAEMAPEARPDGRRLSILVAAWNEAQNIGPLIDSFRALSYPDKELIVCAGGTDGTLAMAQSATGDDVRVVEQGADHRKQTALRRCLAESTGDLIFLTDADCLLSDAAVNGTLAPILAEGEAAAIGSYAPFVRQRTEPLVVFRWSWDVYSGWSRPRYFSTKGVNGVNFAVTRRALEDVGGFSIESRSGIDFHLAMRLRTGGYKVRLVPGSVIETEYYTSPLDYMFWTARGLRSSMILSPGFGEPAESLQLVRSSLRGFAVFLLPLATPFVGRIAINTWCLMIFEYWCSRLRYLLFLHKAQRLPWRWRAVLEALVLSFLDLAAHALALVQALWPRWRDRT